LDNPPDADAGISATEYRMRANGLMMQARIETNPDIKNTLLQLSQGYAHLAELQEKNQAQPIVLPREQIPGPEDSTEA
jgi:hypothetical protein